MYINNHIDLNQGGPNSSWQKGVYNFDLKLLKCMDSTLGFQGSPVVFSGF